MSISFSRRTFWRLVPALALAGAVVPASGAMAATSGPQRFYPAESSRKGLVVYLDGDDQEMFDKAGTGDGPGGLVGEGSVVSAATTRGYDVLAVRSPVSDRWWPDDTKVNRPLTAPVPGGLTIPEKIAYLRSAIDQARTERGADTQNLWLVGYSGGSEFITESFFPAYCQDMAGGGFLILGGGEAPGSTTGVSGNGASLSLNWVTGTNDVSKDYSGIVNAKKGVDFYRRHQFNPRAIWSDDTHLTIIEDFGYYLGLALDGRIPEAPTEGAAG